MSQQHGFKSFKKYLVTGLLALLPVLGLNAQDRGSIEGTVVDSLSGEVIIGANIFITDLGRGDATDVDGKYSIGNIPVGTYRLTVSYLGYATKNITAEVGSGELLVLDIVLSPNVIQGEEITVLAQAAGQIAALKQQMESNTIVNVVSKERLNELPDQNAAAAVSRLPGVSVQRDAGEASKVVVRGLSPKFNSITVNGVRIPGTDPNDRSVDLSLVPPEVLDGIEVFKALTPDKDADAVGGTVNLLVKKAPSGFRSSINLEGGYNDLEHEFSDYKASINVSNRFLDNKLGVLLTGSTQNINRSSEVIDVDYEFGLRNININNLNLADFDEQRERHGASIALDYDLDNHAFYVSSFMGRTDRDEIRRRKRYRVGSTRVEYDLRDRERFNLVYSNSLRGEHLFNRFKFDWQAAHTSSLNKTPFETYVRFRELGAFRNDITGDETYQEIPPFARNEFNQTGMQFSTFTQSRTSDRDFVGEVNGQYSFDITGTISGYIKTGGKFRGKARTHNPTEIRTPHGTTDDIGQANPDDFTLIKGDTEIGLVSFIDQDYDSTEFFGGDFSINPGLDPDKLNNFYSRFSDFYELNRYTELEDYTAGEDISAVYIQTEISFGERVSILPGFRYEYTENSYEGKFGSLFEDLGRKGEITDTTGGQSYAEFLPMVHLKVNILPGIDLRLAYTETLSRPDYFNLVPFESINEVEQIIRRGNPDLKHTTAVNYDAFLSFYNSRIGYLSVGLFYKELENIDFIRETRILDPESDFRGYDLILRENAVRTTTVKGIEVDLQTALRFLPKPLDGLILNTNIAFIDSEAFFPFFSTMRSPETGQLIVQDTVRTGRLPGQPDMTANVTIGYEIKGFSARVSLSHQRDILATVGDTEEEDGVDNSFSFWDVRINQSIKRFKGLSVFADINNLTSEREGAVFGSGKEERVSLIEQFGLRATAGVRYKF